jgi:hypothetical protein
MGRELDDRFDGSRAEFDAVLHPSQAFDRPADVAHSPALTLEEKRAILASWASDACAIEAAPALRKSPSGRLVPFDEIMDALREVDRQVRPAAASRKRQDAASGRVSFSSHAAAAPAEISAMH